MSLTQNRNQLRASQFQFTFHTFPNVEYFVQKVNLPGLSIQPIEQATPLKNVYHAGETLMMDELTVEFLVAEDFQNYMEIYQWLRNLGTPETMSEYQKPEGISGASLHILTNNSNPNKIVDFYNLIPISLSEINFDTMLSDEAVVATAQFRYDYFRITGA